MACCSPKRLREPVVSDDDPTAGIGGTPTDPPETETRGEESQLLKEMLLLNNIASRSLSVSGSSPTTK